MKIDSKDISVVIQGAININTYYLINSIKKYLPNSEIILSTWNGSDVTDIFVDKIIFNIDPGGYSHVVDKKRLNNIERLIVSSINGINAATNKYVLKCRSDIEITGTGFVDFWDVYDLRDDEYALSKHKMIVNSLFTLKGEITYGRLHPTPYHISDWCMFGLKSDLVEYFDVSTEKLCSDSVYYRYHKKLRNCNATYGNDRYWKFPPEQYLGYTYAKRKFPDLEFKSFLEYDNIDFEQAERFIVNNFIVLEPNEYGIVLNKEPYYDLVHNVYHNFEQIEYTSYRKYVYQYDYKKYCDNAFVVDIDAIPKYKTAQYYLENIDIEYKKALTHDNDNEINFCIITILDSIFDIVNFENYLNSYNKYVKDKNSLSLYIFITESNYYYFQYKFGRYFNMDGIRIHIMEAVYAYYGINCSCDSIRNRYGIQTKRFLDEFYAILYVDRAKALVLDSSSYWINDVFMINEAKKYFENPNIFYSIPSLYQSDKEGVILYTDLAAYILNYRTNRTYRDDQRNYYDIKFLKNIIDLYGMPIKFAELSLNKYDGQHGLLLHTVYSMYIEKHKEGYHFINIYDEFISKIPHTYFTAYKDDKRYLLGIESSFSENLTSILRKNTVFSIAKLYNTLPKQFFLVHTDKDLTFIKQIVFLQLTKSYLIISSPNKWFSYKSISKIFILKCIFRVIFNKIKSYI